MIVYKTTNLINGKIYVGQDKNDNPEYLGSGIKILKAIEKYGKSNFRKEKLIEVETVEELDAAEIFWIEKLNAQDPEVGYNISSGGNRYRPKGGTTNEKISQTLKGRKLSKSTRAKMSASRSGDNHWTRKTDFKGFSEETKEKMRAAKIGKRHTKEVVEKRTKALKKSWIGRKAYDRSGENNPFSGKTHTEEARHRMSKIQQSLCWVVSSDDVVKRIPLDELQIYLENGWKQGRKWQTKRKRK